VWLGGGEGGLATVEATVVACGTALLKVVAGGCPAKRGRQFTHGGRHRFELLL
jgi:hypothetical protein